MLVLSRDNLDDLASSIIEDFYQGKILYPDPINIEDLALEYLGLEVSYENLSSDGSILGVTAYAPMHFRADGFHCRFGSKLGTAGPEPFSGDCKIAGAHWKKAVHPCSRMRSSDPIPV